MVRWREVLVVVDSAVAYFRGEGVKPTLRTLFYYLYSKGVIPNTRSAYKRLSTVLVNARKAGRYEWDFLEDKTRVVLGELKDERFEDDVVERFEKTLEETLSSLDIEEMIDETFDYLRPWITVDKWAEQPVVPEVWIEKEALASTIQSWLKDWDIPIRVNRGYSSWTFIYNNVKALRFTLQRHEKVIVYYLGDLDPSGVDIERFLKEALDYFGLDPEEVELKRLAVTSKQVERYGLPPRPEDAETLAKLENDPRYRAQRSFWERAYIVELDALVAYAPSEFRQFVREAVENLWDEPTYEKLDDKARELRKKANELLKEVKEKAKQKIMEELA